MNAHLDLAEDMALRKIPVTVQDGEARLNRFLAATDRGVLQAAGKATAGIARAHAESELEKYRVVQDRPPESDFDRALAGPEPPEARTAGGASRAPKKRKKP